MKIIYLFLITLCLSTTSQAQIIRSFGLKVGATNSSEYWERNDNLPDMDPENRWGFNVGIFSELFNTKYLTLVTEANYFQKGMKEDLPVTTITNPDGTGEYITWDTRVDYINFSALGKMRLDLNKISPYILIGPKVDFQINIESSFGFLNEVEKNFNEVMYGLRIGAGSEFQFESFSLLAEILYDYNFNNLYENENLTVTSDSFDFRVGISL